MALFINGVGQDTFNMNGVSIDNLYVDGVLVWTSVVPEATIPRYELTETLVDASTVDDSANTLPDFNGLLTESDGTTPYEPTALQYPQNGLLELANGRIMDTQFTILGNEFYGLYGIYDADGSTTYKIWAVQLNGLNDAVLYEGDQDTPLAETDQFWFKPDVGTWEITDGRPSWMPPLEFPELVGNPNFDTNIDGVIAIAPCVCTWESPGYWRTTTTSGGRDADYYVYDLVVGVEYIADGVLAASSHSSGALNMKKTDGTELGSIIFDSTYVGPVVFTAEETTVRFSMVSSWSEGQTIDIDSITLKRNL